MHKQGWLLMGLMIFTGAAMAGALGQETLGSSVVVLSFVGDVTLGQNEGQQNEGGSFNRVYAKQGPEYFFSGVQEVLAADDLTIVNFEGVLAQTSADLRAKGVTGRQFWFRGETEYAQILAAGSVEVANLANTHTLDFGETGYRTTMAALQEVGVDHFGRERVLVKQVGGIKIGFYGLTLTGAEKKTQQRLIKKLRDQGAEVIIANFHGGVEGSYMPSPKQRQAAYTAIDLGAEAVIGHHPHVLEGLEYYRDKVIAYSLGNFCFGGNRNPKDKDSIIFQLLLQREGDEIIIGQMCHPVSISSSKSHNDFRPRLLEGQEGERVLAKLEELSAALVAEQLP